MNRQSNPDEKAFKLDEIFNNTAHIRDLSKTPPKRLSNEQIRRLKEAGQRSSGIQFKPIPSAFWRSK
jgi:hypothetical protein